jgi:hypothetical protein
MMGYDIANLCSHVRPFIIKIKEKFPLISYCRIVIFGPNVPLALLPWDYLLLIRLSFIHPAGGNGIEKRKYRKERHQVNWNGEGGFCCYELKGAQ